jgi:hypothetical protein
MDSTGSEVDALRARVSKLEADVAMLKKSMQPIPPLLTPSPPVAISQVISPPRVATKQSTKYPSTVWIAGAGAVIFLIGAVYGLTVSIQRGWISLPMRVGAGLVIGLIFGWGALRQFLRAQPGLGVALLGAGVGAWTFSLYFGSHEAHLFAPWVGLAGSSLATLGAGWLAARVRSDGAMAVALATGLVAPLVFSDGSGNVLGLLTYLLVLSGTQLLAHYLMRAGARWAWTRVLGSAGLWFVVMMGVSQGSVVSVFSVTGMIVALGVISLGVAWLPKHTETPLAGGAMSVVNLVGVAFAWWIVWKRSDFETEGFATVLVSLAAVSALLVPFARGRVSSRVHDLPLLLLAIGFGFLAVPVAFDWRWVVLAWATLAVLLAWAARVADRERREDRDILHVVATFGTLAASLVWFALVVDQGRGEMLFFNRVFAGAMLTGVAWASLAFRTGKRGALPFGLLQLVVVNAIAWELSRGVPLLRSEHTALAVGPLLATLVYALTGAGLWLRGVMHGAFGGAKALRVSGYAWLIVASVKLLVSDLARADLLFRAAAALGVGGILIAAAWWASHRRAE